ncbi:hypothetical protein EUX98_g4636 [Antrodiella citrinella]|uniref:Uncharacterized protein n=1 Tax=Antrodiella citrinella TaxID=2447956 RepID=A0A4S4N1H5_9APHY|nr:hypothetical protein EUX98_g4636 [Antrodiella citrinella]
MVEQHRREIAEHYVPLHVYQALQEENANLREPISQLEQGQPTITELDSQVMQMEMQFQVNDGGQGTITDTFNTSSDGNEMMPFIDDVHHRQPEDTSQWTDITACAESEFNNAFSDEQLVYPLWQEFRYSPPFGTQDDLGHDNMTEISSEATLVQSSIPPSSSFVIPPPRVSPELEVEAESKHMDVEEESELNDYAETSTVDHTDLQEYGDDGDCENGEEDVDGLSDDSELEAPSSHLPKFDWPVFREKKSLKWYNIGEVSYNVDCLEL